MEKGPIRALFVDIGGVLLTNGWDHLARRKAAEAFHYEFDEVEERHALLWELHERGAIGLDEYLARAVFFRGRSFSPAEFTAFLFAQSLPLSGMIELIARTKERHGLRVVAVSNEGRELTEHRIRTFRLDAVIDFFVSSCFVRVRKPDAEIYRIALDCSRVLPEEVLYLEDRPLFLEIARDLGIRGIRHVEIDRTLTELASSGLSLDVR